MESVAKRPVGRPRKRRRNDVKNVAGNQQSRPGSQPKKRVVDIRGTPIVGRYVLKEFKGSGVFLGKVVDYDAGLYRVDYEDGDCEDLDSGELRESLIGEEYFDDDLKERRKKLDDVVSNKRVKLMQGSDKGDSVAVKNDSCKEGKDSGETSMKSELPNGEVNASEVDDDADSSTDSCEYAQEWDTRSESEVPVIPPPEFPPSSGTISVPEECVLHLLSVYGFLRSFAIRLFLSPFTLDDLVGCLNCTVPNSLLDAIHVALLRTLRRHLESLSSDGSELAIKCLRYIDWALLDTLTWPVYLVHYLMVFGYSNGDEWKGFYVDALEQDYCTLSVAQKLMVLQILCDDALESAEIRAEIDMREEAEVGIDADGLTSVPPEIGPRRGHPRYSKALPGMFSQPLVAGAESNGLIPSNSGGSYHNGDAAVIVEDANGDECRLCGMDGTLLCCDGCPSAYHSRCIGVGKMYIPEGPWFCPECAVSKIGPTVTVGTSLKGAELFGVDSYGEVFMGTCDHLLVLNVSAGMPSTRYYNCNDIPKVLKTLHSSVHHSVSYSGICQAILKYWEMPQEVLPLPATVQTTRDSGNSGEVAVLPIVIHPFSESGSENTSEKVVVEKYPHAGECMADNVAGSTTENCSGKPGFHETSFDATNQIHPTSGPRSCTNMNIKLSEQSKTDSTMASSSVTLEAGVSSLTQQGFGDGSRVSEFASCTSGYNDISVGRQRLGGRVSANALGCGKEGINAVGGGSDQKLRDNCLYMGSSFKPRAYTNHYVHGDFAASAAANLAVLSSEDNRVADVNALNNPRKVMSANILQQVKAFTLAAVRFFWPNPDKKLVEVPRERCGWCLSCKAAATSKKACLINAAALNATRGAMKIISELHLAKNIDGGLYGIAMYTQYMEESLHGLIVGPFLDASYRQQWRKQVQQISTCSEIKVLLLRLEENLRTIALSGEWSKQVDNLMDESSAAQNTCLAGSTQKRGASGRRNRKQLSTSEVFVEEVCEKLSGFCWWRRGKVSKLVFNKGTLPRAMLRRAARQGGSRKICGICYAEGSDIPKRSRQLIWRAAVEMSKNASQLAVQIRYLDHHVRWGDLGRPEQNLHDGKGPETEASAFRNAFICGKKLVDDKIMYAVTFGQQKHLPSRVMKSIIEKEESDDGKDKYWFLEARVPLYLIKEYEENVEKVGFSPASNLRDTFSKLQSRQLKASRKDIFLYLARKKEDLAACFCASCHRDVLLRNAVKCSECEGYCHKDCTLSSAIPMKEDVEFIITCRLCYHGKVLPQSNSSVESPTSPLALQGQEYQKAPAVSNSAKQKGNHQQTSSVGTIESCSEMKTAAPDSSLVTKNRKRLCHWGLIWKKKNADDTGADFRLKHIMWRGNPDMKVESPLCHLCQKPYNRNLMYIRCETCQDWYHADAVELDESKILELVGFKCCRCRRIKSPVCPYADPDRKKSEGKKARVKSSKRGKAEADSVSHTLSELTESSIPTTPISPIEEDVFIQVDDPILFSVSKVELIPEQKPDGDFEWDARSGLGPQKLPVRRHMKNEKDADVFTGFNPSQVELSAPLESADLTDPVESFPSHAEWDVSASGPEDGVPVDYENFYYKSEDFEPQTENFNYEDVDYEPPQTYFSFTELLDDGGEPEGADASGNISCRWEDLTFTNSQSGFPEQCELSTRSNGHMEPVSSVEPAVYVPCRMCCQTAPAPDLSCQNCGLKIHSHCSPWEDLSEEESWKCGNCRGWR
ncbi:hypothetical protein Ancab_011195 [Ancistrocladus abbreviatus]